MAAPVQYYEQQYGPGGRSFNITLEPSGVSVPFNRQQFIEAFPDSIPTGLLESDPNLQNVEIQGGASVTPDVLYFLGSYLAGVPPYRIPPMDVLQRAGHFLWIDLVGLSQRY